jgi:hypothetical protein|tara:strand:+ start:291 stop:590 length:300 start_codon:yes stop_codon:yes gene_type:complete
MGNVKKNMKPPEFDPEGSGYDYKEAERVGMTRDKTGHMGSVALTTKEQQLKFNLPKESYIILKGKSHETFDKAVKAEQNRGFIVKKKGNRYFSVPRMSK